MHGLLSKCDIYIIESEKVLTKFYFFKKDGTFVEGYWRTSPNNTNRDNFSTKGNENPYNGKIGWIEPDNNNLNTYNQ